MGLFRRSNASSSTGSSEVRRPILDPDSDAIIWATPAEAADEATVDRMLAQARADLDRN